MTLRLVGHTQLIWMGLKSKSVAQPTGRKSNNLANLRRQTNIMHKLVTYIFISKYHTE